MMMGNGEARAFLVDNEASGMIGSCCMSFPFFTTPTSNRVHIVPCFSFFFLFLMFFQHLLLPICWLRPASPAVPTLMSSPHSEQCAVVVVSYFILSCTGCLVLCFNNKHSYLRLCHCGVELYCCLMLQNEQWIPFFWLLQCTEDF